MKIRRSSILKYAFIPVLSCFILAIFLLTFSVNSHASTSSNLPYYVDYYRSAYFNSNPENILYYNVNLVCDLRWCGEPYQYNNTYRVVLYYVNFNSNTYELKNHSLNTNLDYSIFNFTYDYFIFNNVNYILFELGQDGNFHQVGYNMSDGVSSSVAILGKSSAYKNSFGWTSNVPHALKSGSVLYYNSDVSKPIFINGTPSSSVDTGHALPPDNFNNPEYTNNHVPPHYVPPHYTINNYTWSTPPTLDFSTIEHGLESLGDLIKWLSNNISGEFSNLIDNLKGLFDFIGDTLNYYGDLIIDNIQNGINTFYYNMKSLVEPILDGVNKIGVIAGTIVALGTDPDTNLFSIPYLTQVLLVPDVSSLELLLVNHDDFHLVSIGQNLVTMSLTIHNTLTHITPSGVIHVPSCYYHGQQIGNFDIDFSWFNQYKAYSDILVSGFLIFGYFYWLYITFASHIKGVFMPDVTPEDDSYKRHNIGF